MEKKEVKMQTGTAKTKLTYEELENVCHQLSEQSRTLYQKLQDADMTNLFKRLDYLFEVVKYKDTFFDYGHNSFISDCIKEIVSSMTLPETTEEEKKEE